MLLSSSRSHGEEEQSGWVVKYNWQVVLSAQATLKEMIASYCMATTLFRHKLVENLDKFVLLI